MPYSMQEFAARIKAKYPSYASIHDDDLVAQVVSKHPEYKNQVVLDPRSEIAYRKENPPENVYGDKNSQVDTSRILAALPIPPLAAYEAYKNPEAAKEVAIAGTKGLAHTVGLPTSTSEMRDHLLNTYSLGAYNAVKQAKDLTEGHIPVIGRPVEAVLGPAAAVGHGRAPTNEENLAAVESGTTLGAMAAAQSGAVGRMATKVAPGVAGALEGSATAQYGKALGGGPLAEAIGSQLAERGTVMRNPKVELATATVAEESVPMFSTAEAAQKQLGALKGKYQNAEVVQEGNQYTIRHRAPQEIIDQAQSPKPLIDTGLRGLGRHGAAGIASMIGTAVGGPHVGAAIAGTIEAGIIGKRIIQNPLYNTFSASTKMRLAKAMRSNDFATASDMAARILGVTQLDDKYGHDQAVRDVVNQSLEQAGGDKKKAGQLLRNNEAFYENIDGSRIPVPYHIISALWNMIESAGGDDKTVRHDFAGNAIGPAPNETQDLRAYFGPVGQPKQ